jgi:hypothetical protein
MIEARVDREHREERREHLLWVVEILDRWMNFERVCLYVLVLLVWKKKQTRIFVSNYLQIGR